MELNNPVEPISEALPLSDQNITSEAPKLLLCSSIASVQLQQKIFWVIYPQ